MYTHSTHIQTYIMRTTFDLEIVNVGSRLSLFLVSSSKVPLPFSFFKFIVIWRICSSNSHSRLVWLCVRICNIQGIIMKHVFLGENSAYAHNFSNFPQTQKIFYWKVAYLHFLYVYVVHVGSFLFWLSGYQLRQKWNWKVDFVKGIIVAGCCSIVEERNGRAGAT